MLYYEPPISHQHRLRRGTLMHTTQSADIETVGLKLERRKRKPRSERVSDPKRAYRREDVAPTGTRSAYWRKGASQTYVKPAPVTTVKLARMPEPATQERVREVGCPRCFAAGGSECTTLFEPRERHHHERVT